MFTKAQSRGRRLPTPVDHNISCRESLPHPCAPQRRAKGQLLSPVHHSLAHSSLSLARAWRGATPPPPSSLRSIFSASPPLCLSPRPLPTPSSCGPHRVAHSPSPAILAGATRSPPLVRVAEGRDVEFPTAMHITTRRLNRFPNPLDMSTRWRDKIPIPVRITTAQRDWVPHACAHLHKGRDWVSHRCAQQRTAAGPVPFPCAHYHKAEGPASAQVRNSTGGRAASPPLCGEPQGGGNGSSTHAGG